MICIKFIRSLILLFLATILCSCATGKYMKLDLPRTKDITIENYKLVYVEANELSEYEIQKLSILGFLFYPSSSGVLSSPITTLETDDFKEGERRGDIAIHIAKKMGELGFQPLVGPKALRPDDTDLIIRYTDTWKRRFVWSLDSLVIRFIDAKTGKNLLKGWYQNQDTIVKNPEKQVRKTIETMLSPEPETKLY